MFSGIVEETGVVKKVEAKKNLYVLTLAAGKTARGTRVGDSIAVNGVCLTVTAVNGRELSFDIMKETLEATTLGGMKPQARVNLERSLKMSSRIGGHFVTGHVDGVGVLRKIVTQENYVEFRIAASRALLRYVAAKGSVSLDGVSLTIGRVWKGGFAVYLIPHTLAVTTFGPAKAGDRMNIETDILARYILKERGFLPSA